MTSKLLKVVFCFIFCFSSIFFVVNESVGAVDPVPGDPLVTGTPSLNASVVVLPYDVDLFGLYLVQGDQMTPINSIPVESIHIDQVTAKLSPDGLKVAFLVKYGSTGFSKLEAIGANGLNAKILYESHQPDQYITSFEWSHDSLSVAYSLSADHSVFPDPLAKSFEDPTADINPLDPTVLPEQVSRFTGEVWAADITTLETKQIIDEGAQEVLGWTPNDTGIIFSEYTTDVSVAEDPAVGNTSPVSIPEALPAGVSVVSIDAHTITDLNNLVTFPTGEGQPVTYGVSLLEDDLGDQKLAVLSTDQAFQTTPAGDTTLSLGDLDFGSSIQLVTPLSLAAVLTSPDGISQLSLSPDGNHLAYATEREEALWSADSDGTDQTKLLDNGVASMADIFWNTANTGVTAWMQDASQVKVMSVGEEGTVLGNLAVVPSTELQDEPAVTGDVRNYSVPYVHQIYDTLDSFNGRCACGPTSATMAMAAYGKISPHSITISIPSSHTNDYGFYVSEKFGPFQSPRYNPSPCPAGNGIYGQTVRDGGGGREYIDDAITTLGVNGSWAQYQATFDIVKAALDRGHLVIMSTQLTSAGHIILIKGYTNTGQIIVNDPYGNKFAGSYGKRVIDGGNVYYNWNDSAPKWYIEVEGSFNTNPNPVITQWKGEYFNNRSLSGNPSVVRNDGDINFNWGNGSPAGGIGSDNFSVRWTRTMNFERGTYKFTAGADDGLRVYVDNNRVIDKWIDQGFTSYTSQNYFLDGGNHTIKMEYYENGGDAAARLSWARATDDGGSGDGWSAQYYNNRSLSGSPTFTRNDTSVYFNWGTGGPGNGVGNDNFGVRWTKNITVPKGGNYRVFTRSDDGIRVWVDNTLRIDVWRDMSPTTYVSTSFYMAQGQHSVRIDYYENAGGAYVRAWIEPAFYTEYYRNRSLSGSPVKTEYVQNVNFNWGLGGPAGLGVSDNFSIRWTGSLSLSGGQYSFCTRTDDGVRLYLDNVAIIDQWHDMGATTYCTQRTVNKGFHDLRMEYYENGGYASAQMWWSIVNGETSLGAASGSSLQAAADTDDEIMTLYNDNGYLGPLIESDVTGVTVSYPPIYLPLIFR